MAGRSADPAHVRDYFGIRRDYPVEEFINDVKPQGVTKSVHVTAMWGPGRASTKRAGFNPSPTSMRFPHGIVWMRTSRILTPKRH